ncbi:MAG: SDR family oxidoreductase [Pseudomonadota bacterium]|nr:SDR family oxidoreductase [Pseudomonadota bacterium]
MSIRLKPLNQQVLVVTGASSGIGFAIASEAVDRGAAVLLVSRNEEALQQIAADLRKKGGRVAVCAADVGIPADLERVANAATAEFGGFDTWVNDAGVTAYGSMEQISFEDHRRIFEVNYFGLLRGSFIAAKHLRDRGGGAIINMGSILSDRTIIFQGPYSASKHAVLAATDALRMDLEREDAGISVTLIKPGAIHTLFTGHARNYMDEPPAFPPIIYDPRLVADAVLFAAEKPKRVLYVGGFGYVQSLLGRMFPRVTDRIMEAVMVRAQQAPDDPTDPERRDNLYRPRPEGEIEGSQQGHIRRQSLFLQAQKHPIAAAAALGGIALAALSVLASRSQTLTSGVELARRRVAASVGG